MYRWVIHEGIEQNVQSGAAKNKKSYFSQTHSNEHIICLSRLKIINDYNASNLGKFTSGSNDARLDKSASFEAAVMPYIQYNTHSVIHNLERSQIKYQTGYLFVRRIR